MTMVSRLSSGGLRAAFWSGRRGLATATEAAGPVTFRKLTGSDAGIAVYGLNAAATRNALSFDMVDAMREVTQLIREDTKISVVVLHSLVPGIFCAGQCM